ncbi:hypothetical protein CGCA056_v012922 [Colletotrichum aenigma]|uniref:uncharacterized protein n=1 Tax=Colletotrichum aenigma TaxID=1215731 RepID=UPI0018722608|nr:uncharacterized protein CGCA056_v012922 [Colletotrichum aenigma]KAF5507552.1 hypothetical protein CGCA056_v012922 [Colletotrichum aenigma]
MVTDGGGGVETFGMSNARVPCHLNWLGCHGYERDGLDLCSHGRSRPRLLFLTPEASYCCSTPQTQQHCLHRLHGRKDWNSIPSPRSTSTSVVDDSIALRRKE